MTNTRIIVESMTTNNPTPDETAALLRIAEQQLDQWKAECRALEARLAAQQPVIDAAIAWEREPDPLDDEANSALIDAVVAYERALSGSVEAGTPAERERCECGCTHQHEDTGVIGGDTCILCRYCSRPRREVSD
jgi:hypothetical protein